MKQRIIHLLRRIAYWIEHKRDDYGKPGFTQYFYRGIPIRQSDIVKNNVIGFYNKETNTMQWLNILTGKMVKNPFKTKYTYKVTAFNESGETILSKSKKKRK